MRSRTTIPDGGQVLDLTARIEQARRAEALALRERFYAAVARFKGWVLLDLYNYVATPAPTPAGRPRARRSGR